MSGRVPRGKAVVWLVALGGLVYLGHASLYGGWINDDAGISFTYARNLANGHGLVLNPGGERVEGYSNPLWVFLLGFFSYVGLFHPVVTAKALGVALGLGALWLAYRLSVRAFGGRGSPLHALAPLLLAYNVSFVTWTVSGLENGLFVFLLLASMNRLIAELDVPRRWPASGFLLFLVSITRPEGIIYVAVALAYSALRCALRLRVTRWDMIRVLVFLTPFFIYHAWHYAYFADVFPNTYYAKGVAGSAQERLERELLDWESVGWRYARDARDDYALGYPLAAALAVVLLGLRRTGPAPLLVIGALAAAVLHAVYVRGDWMPQYRFLTPAFCAAYLLIGGALIAAGRWISRGSFMLRLPPLVEKGALALLAIGLLIPLLRPNAWVLSAEKRHPPVTFATMVARGQRLGALSQELDLTNASLLDPDLGGTSYASGLRMIDLGGLADVHIARHHYDQRFLGRYIFEEQKPTFIHTHCIWSKRARLHSDPRFLDSYLPLWESPCSDDCCAGSLDGEYIRKDVFVVQEPRLRHKADRSFGSVVLLGYDAGSDVAAAGRSVSLATYWVASGPDRAGMTIMAALVGPDGTPHASPPRSFGHDIYPASDWRVGEVIEEKLSVQVPADAREGEYSIIVSVGAPNAPAAEHRVGTIVIDSEGARAEARRHIELAERASAQGDLQPAVESVAAARRLFPEGTAELSTTSDRVAERIALRIEALIEAGDLMPASHLLEETSAALGMGNLESAGRALSRRWFQRGEELLAREDAFLSWSEAFDAFAQALRARPANSSARKRMEELRVKFHIATLYGPAILSAHEERAQPADVLDLLLRLEDEGYRAEVMEILAASGTMRDQLASLGTIPALALINNVCLARSAGEECAGALARARAIAPQRTVLGGKLRLLDVTTSSGEAGSRVTFWFEVIQPMAVDYKMFLHGQVDDVTILPEARRQYGFANFDHYPEPPTSEWKVGHIIRHTHRLETHPGMYDLRFGFFASKEGKSLLVDGSESPAVRIGPRRLGP